MRQRLYGLELRELRLKMKQKGEADLSLVIGAWSLGFPGAARRWFREPDGRAASVSDFDISLLDLIRWGTEKETGQQWLRVTDNGVGMTEEVIKNYLTKIGKRYYRSPNFN